MAVGGYLAGLGGGNVSIAAHHRSFYGRNRQASQKSAYNIRDKFYIDSASSVQREK